MSRFLEFDEEHNVGKLKDPSGLILSNLYYSTVHHIIQKVATVLMLKNKQAKGQGQ